MFTGLVQEVGKIVSVEDKGPDRRIAINVSFDVKKVQMGASICCSGCCLSVVDKGEGSVSFDVSAETLSKTIIGSWEVGGFVNIEPSLRLGDEMGGHIVSGHIDTTSSIVSIKEYGGSHRVKIKLPEGFKQYIASKGSVAVDGVSLTVNEVEKDYFGVNLIPHTWDNTTLGHLSVGDQVNIEVDMLARYVSRMLEVGKV